MTPKVALQKIRQLAKRGSNEMLLRAIEDVYLTGVNHGMQTLSNTLRERLHDLKNTSDGNNSDGERGEPNSSESIGGGGVDANDGNSAEGSRIAASDAP